MTVEGYHPRAEPLHLRLGPYLLDYTSVSSMNAVEVPDRDRRSLSRTGQNGKVSYDLHVSLTATPPLSPDPTSPQRDFSFLTASSPSYQLQLAHFWARRNASTLIPCFAQTRTQSNASIAPAGLTIATRLPS